MSFQSSITEYDNSTNCSSICLNNNLKKLEKDIPVPIIENNTTKAEDEYVPYSKNTNVDTKNTTDNNKYSLAEINKRLELISKKYGIECKIDILLNILGIEDKKDLDLDITKVNNLMNVLDAALAECKDKKTGNADINRAIELSKQKYNTEAKAVTNDTNNKTLNELLGLPDNATNDDIEVAINEKWKDMIKNECSFDEFVQNFQLYLTKVPDEQKGIFLNVLNSSNNEKIINSFILSFKDDKSKINFVKKLGSNGLSSSAPKVVQILSSYLDKDSTHQVLSDIDKNLDNTCTPERYKEIQDKVDNGIELTQEENSIYNNYNKYTDTKSEVEIGVANTKVMTDEDRDILLVEIDRSAQKYPTYRRHLENIARYVQENPDNIPIGREKFEALMDKVSDKNYSRVINDIKNGTKTELVTSKPKEKLADTEKQSKTTKEKVIKTPEQTEERPNIGFSPRKKPVQNNSEGKKAVQKDAPVSTEKKINPEIVTYLTSENFEATKKEQGMFGLAYDIIAGKKETNNRTIIDNVLGWVKSQDIASKCIFLSKASDEFFNKIVQYIGEDTAQKFIESGQKCNNIYNTLRVKKLAQGDEEQV